MEWYSEHHGYQQKITDGNFSETTHYEHGVNEELVSKATKHTRNIQTSC